MNLTIYPYECVGPVRFGMTVEQVRAALGAEPHVFSKTPSSVFPTDAFRNMGVHVHYESTGICEAIEMGYPASPVFQGETLIGWPFEAVVEWFRERDENIVISETGLNSMKLGVSVYAPYAKDAPSEPVKGIMAFARGYWD